MTRAEQKERRRKLAHKEPVFKRVKCIVHGCNNYFIKRPANNVYCRSCAEKEGYLRRKEYEQRRNKTDPEGMLRYHRERARKHLLQVKIETLSYYGKGGKLLCCWHGCDVCDPDMLSLDHINDDGKIEMKQRGYYVGGSARYRELKSQGYPDGFQTLCFNHQFKKEISRRRRLRLK